MSHNFQITFVKILTFIAVSCKSGYLDTNFFPEQFFVFRSIIEGFTLSSDQITITCCKENVVFMKTETDYIHLYTATVMKHKIIKTIILTMPSDIF